MNSSVSSSITCLGVIFVFASLFPTLFLLIAVVFVINYGLECFAIWVLLIFIILHINCLNISFVLVNLNLGV